MQRFWVLPGSCVTSLSCSPCQLQRKLDQTRQEVKLMQDEFFKKDRSHQEALDKKREERNEAMRELGTKQRRLARELCCLLVAYCSHCAVACKQSL